MRFLNITFLFLALTVLGKTGYGQTSDRLSPINYDNYKEFCAILHDGTPIVKPRETVEELLLTADMTGTLTVSTVDRSGNNFQPLKSVGFRLAIKNHRTNALWMFSPDVLQEVNVEEVLKKCEYGDKLIFITIDRKLQLPRHELRVNLGC